MSNFNEPPYDPQASHGEQPQQPQDWQSPQQPTQPPQGWQTPQQPQGWQSPPQQWQQPPKQRRNGFGVSALVLGIIGVIFALIPVIGIFVSWPLALLALVFGGIGMLFAFRGRASKGISVAGTALGVTAFIVSIVTTASLVSESDTTASTEAGPAASDSSSPSTSNPSTEKKKEKKKTAEIGDTVKSGKFQFTVTDVKNGVHHVGPSDFGKDADGQFIVVSIKVKNIGDSAETFMGEDEKLIDKSGKEYSTDTEAGIYIKGNDTFLDDINPGNTAKGKLAYDVPKKVHPQTIRFSGSIFAKTVDVKLS